MSQHKDVKETVVVAHEDRPKDKRIVAYVALMRQKHADASHELHRFLK